ncbi:hypothetical protein DSCA_60050 [Desulfosarcina alkanivorans]|uniref:Small ribosomal subunit protein bS21 n=1 Tax=Desulfosarcina alkanivorans TaxID=571177 RepID=A0A5K7YUG3_9BACT|nr:hypothetical protein DSCA_60050 [Desulfosarcina alkanivorans]
MAWTRDDNPEVEVNGDFSKALRLFRKRVDRANIYSLLGRRRVGVSKSGVRRLKEKKALKRRMRVEERRFRH